MKQQEDDPVPAAPSEAKTRPGMKPVFVLIAIVAMGGAYWAGRRTAPVAAASVEEAPVEEAAPESDTPEEEESRALVVFEPLVVNLADTGGSRFVRVTVQLVVPGMEDAERLKKAAVPLVQARAAMLEILSQQTAEQLVTKAGKADVKKAIAERLAELIPDIQVIDVLFSDFVVQF